MEDKKKDKPKIPSLKDSTRPQVKIKGIGGKLSLVERLKQFKKKDLAFIAAGLGVLFMAPLAEHFMMSPETAETGAFKEGWGFRDAAGGFGSSGFPYEGGYNNLAPGSLLGGEADVITPLNVRDPAALVMGPGGMKAKPVSQPAPTKSSSSSPDWKDALAQAASKASSEVKKSARLPVPKIPFKGGLRGLGAISGGGGGSYTLPKLSARNVPNRAVGSNSLSRVKTATGYRGTAGMRGRNNASSGALENLKKAAMNAGREMNRGGSAAGNLETAAAASSMPGGTGSSLGGRGEGAKDKGPGGSSSGGNARGGNSESLAFQLKKKRMNMELANELKQKFADENFWPDMKRELTKTTLTTLTKGLTEGFMKMIADAGKSSDGTVMWTCHAPEDNPFWKPRKVDGNCATLESGEKAAKTSGYCSKGTVIVLCGGCFTGADPVGTICKPSGDAAADPDKPKARIGPPGAEQAEQDRKDAVTGKRYSGKQDLAGICKGLVDYKESLKKGSRKGEDKLDETNAFLDQMQVAGRKIVVARDLISTGVSEHCSGGKVKSIKPKYGEHIYDTHELAAKDLLGMKCQMVGSLQVAGNGLTTAYSNFTEKSGLVVENPLSCAEGKGCVEKDRKAAFNAKDKFTASEKEFNEQRDLWKSAWDGKTGGEGCPDIKTKGVEAHAVDFGKKMEDAETQMTTAEGLLTGAQDILKENKVHADNLIGEPQKFVVDLNTIAQEYLADLKEKTRTHHTRLKNAYKQSTGGFGPEMESNRKLLVTTNSGAQGRVENAARYLSDMPMGKVEGGKGVFSNPIGPVVPKKYKDKSEPMSPAIADYNYDNDPKVIGPGDYVISQAQFTTAKAEFERKTKTLLDAIGGTDGKGGTIGDVHAAESKVRSMEAPEHPKPAEKDTVASNQ